MIQVFFFFLHYQTYEVCESKGLFGFFFSVFWASRDGRFASIHLGI